MMNKTTDAVKVTKAQEVHIPGMAHCHIKSSPGRFTTEMGHHWLCALYRFFIRYNRSICHVAVDTDGNIVGLAVGGDPHIREEFLNSALFRYPHLILWKFHSKRIVRRVLLQELARKLKRKRVAPHSGETMAPSNKIHSGNLVSICVLPDYEGTGIAGKLIESFQHACKAEGYQRLTLSVSKQNSHAVAFYKKHGWRQSDISGESIRFVLDL
jgi:ribosomal protein S18 acetylase RimI-like enzyme